MCIQEMTQPIGNDKNWKKVEDNPDFEAWEKIEVNPKDIARTSDDSQEWIHNYNKNRYSARCPYCNKLIEIKRRKVR